VAKHVTMQEQKKPEVKDEDLTVEKITLEKDVERVKNK
jgi:hypothetical protein